MSRKKKRGIIHEVFEGSVFDAAESSFDKSPEKEYSISVMQTPDGTKVRPKAGKNADVNEFRKQLQQQYPDAKVEIDGGRAKPLVGERSTRTLKHKSDSEENNKTDR